MVAVQVIFCCFDDRTERGVKHLHELAQAQRAGYQCAVAFVVQMEGITEVRPNLDGTMGHEKRQKVYLKEERM